MSLIAANNKAPELAAIREQVHDTATKIWLAYVDSERKATYKNPWEIHNQIQSVTIKCSALLKAVVLL